MLSLSNSTAAAWGKAVKRDAGNGQSHAQEIAVRDEKKREMMSDAMSRSRRVSRLVYFSSRQAESCHLRQTRRRYNSPRSNSALISPASSTTLLNLIRASSSRALASLLHHRLEPPVSHRQRQRSPPQPELPARNSTISIVRCVRGATDLASQSARTVHALQKVPTTTHVPPFHYQISRRRVTLSPWRALLCSEPPSTGPDCVVAGALVGLSCPPVRQRTR